MQDFQMKNLTKHHEIPRSRNGTNEKENIKMLDEKEHNNRHRAHSNETPAEQIFKVISINTSCLNVDFKRSLIEVLKFFKGNYYKENCIYDDPKDKISF